MKRWRIALFFVPLPPQTSKQTTYETTTDIFPTATLNVCHHDGTVQVTGMVAR